MTDLRDDRSRSTGSPTLEERKAAALALIRLVERERRRRDGEPLLQLVADEDDDG